MGLFTKKKVEQSSELDVRDSVRSNPEPTIYDQFTSYKQILQTHDDETQRLDQIYTQYEKRLEDGRNIKKKLIKQIRELNKYDSAFNEGYSFKPSEYLVIDQRRVITIQVTGLNTFKISQMNDGYDIETRVIDTYGSSTYRYNLILDAISLKDLLTLIDKINKKIKQNYIPKYQQKIAEQNLMDALFREGGLYCPHCGEQICNHDRS